MTKKELSIWEANPANIWIYQQNHPELVIKDMLENWEKVKNEYIQDVQKGNYENDLLSRFCDLIRLSMLCRGINKWLKVRRDLIAYKKLLKHEVINLMDQIPILKADMTAAFRDWNDPTVTTWEIAEYFKKREKYLIAKELLKYKTKVRGDLKALCYTDRWQIWHENGKSKKLTDMNTIKASDI